MGTKALILGTVFSGQGRLMRKRSLGKVSFWVVRTEGYDIQLLIEAASLENYTELLNTSHGSVLRFSGTVTLSKSGETSVKCNILVVSAPCTIHFLGWNHEIHPERRYEDCVIRLLNEPRCFEFFKRISLATREIRRFLWYSGFTEFNTGILRHHWEGGTARPFTTHCNANNQEYILSLTSELKLKKLQAAGFTDVFEITQSFRNEGIDSLHSPEFTLLEACKIGATCTDMMELLEEMLSATVQEIYSVPKIQCENKAIDYRLPFRRVSFYAACEMYLCVPKEKCVLEEFVTKYPGTFTSGMGKFTWVFKVINKLLAPHFDNPTFVTDIPSGISPLIKSNPIDSQVSNRSALIIAGLDIADVYEDENNPDITSNAMRVQQEEAGVEVNEDHLDLLRFGVPPSSSIGLGLNRFFMTLSGDLPRHIKETILFPL